jgi:uncharacterized repeat protein (TIGR01451 family)
VFDGGNSTYCSQAAQAAHHNLTSFLNWTITDGGFCLPGLGIISEDIINLEENNKVAVKVVALDPQFDAITFTISGGADQTLFSIDSTSGLLSFVNFPDYENPISSTNSNTYQVEVTAIDNGHPQEETTQLLTIHIMDLDETNPIDLNIQINASSQSVVSGSLIDFTVTLYNNGLENALNVRVMDYLPAEIIDSSWICNATGTASCAALSGIGQIDEIIDIPNDSSSIIYTVTATVMSEFLTSFNYQSHVLAENPQFEQLEIKLAPCFSH